LNPDFLTALRAVHAHKRIRRGRVYDRSARGTRLARRDRGF
jgi:hypothetical protein